MTPPQTESPTIATRTDEHIGLIDYVRTVAILLVLGFHLSIESFGHRELLEARLSFTDGNLAHLFLALMPTSYGFIGVSIFFFVSGFCIHLSHARSKRQEYKVFFVRRFFRIYPPYFLALCFFAFVFPYTKLESSSLINIFQFLSHLLMVHNLDHRSFYGVNGAFWSVGVEVQLYAIYPLLLLFVRRLGWNKALMITAAIEMTIRGMSHLPSLISCSPFCAWFSWSIGARIADDYLNKRPLTLAKWPLWFWPLMSIATYFYKPLCSYNFPCVSLSAATFVAFFISHPDVRLPLPRLLCDWLRWIGVISYSIYLLHGPLFAYWPHQIRKAFPAHHFPPFEMGLCLLCYCGFILFVSWLFYRFVELPGIAIGKWIIKRMPPKHAPTQQPAIA